MTKTKIGTRANASIILAFVKDTHYRVWYSRLGPIAPWGCGRVVDYTTHEDYETFPMPEGWKFLGEGWSRMAFLGPDGVVYKVAKPKVTSGSGRASLDCNRSESDRFKDRAASVRMSGYRLAACRLLYVSVLAMEYVPYDESKALDWHTIYEIERATGIGDLHTTNVWADQTGIPTIIDYAG